jgi:hypothetical protein
LGLPAQFISDTVAEGKSIFFDAVIRLGADRVKMLVFSLSLLALDKGGDARIRAAKSASISVIGKIIAEQMNLREDLVVQIEAGGLISQLGRGMLMKARDLGMEVSDEFVDKYENHMAARIIEWLDLDPFLKNTLDLSTVEFDEDSFSPGGIIELAKSVTESSFNKYGKLIVQSPMPDKEGIVARTPGDDIKTLFTILGVEEFLEIREVPTQRQKEALTKRQKNQPLPT